MIREQDFTRHAREEAARLSHEYVGTEHILLGLLRDRNGVAAAVIDNLGVDRAAIQRLVDETVVRGKPPGDPSVERPLTSKSQDVLESAVASARELNHTYVGTEHLLLGLIREDRGIAGQVLKDAGVDLKSARAETLRLLGTPES
jgi:ATP-dependent Clp protease ATP-binding subunit ClpC